MDPQVKGSFVYLPKLWYLLATRKLNRYILTAKKEFDLCVKMLGNRSIEFRTVLTYFFCVKVGKIPINHFYVYLNTNAAVHCPSFWFLQSKPNSINKLP